MLIAVSHKQFMLSTSNLAFNIMRDMSQRLRKRARETELMNIDAITASIVHEIKQPLSAISANSRDARRFLGKTPPNIQEARGCLIRIVAECVKPVRYLTAFARCFKGPNRSETR
jgi:signal transduction histidine kinase